MESDGSMKCEWVQLLDPKTQQMMYVNLVSGECCQDPPKNSKVKTMSPNQWWELYDVKAERNYYYNSTSRETVWQKPANGDIIPLAKLQLLQQSSINTATPQIDCKQITDANNHTLDMGIFRRSNSTTTSNTNNNNRHSSNSTSSTVNNCTNTSKLYQMKNSNTYFTGEQSSSLIGLRTCLQDTNNNNNSNNNNSQLTNDLNDNNNNTTTSSYVKSVQSKLYQTIDNSSVEQSNNPTLTDLMMMIMQQQQQQQKVDNKSRTDLPNSRSQNLIQNNSNQFTSTDFNIDQTAITTTTTTDGTQRVRDWLIESDSLLRKPKSGSIDCGEQKSPIENVITHKAADSINNVNNKLNQFKKVGCLSDRPVRRFNLNNNHLLHGLVEFPSPIDDDGGGDGDDDANIEGVGCTGGHICPVTNPLVSSTTPTIPSSVMLLSVSANDLFQHQQYTVENSIADSQNPTHQPVMVSNALNMNLTHHSPSHAAAASLLLVNPNHVKSSTEQFPHLSPLQINQQIGTDSLQPTVTRQRAFPRTNPTVSRSGGSCTLPRPNLMMTTPIDSVHNQSNAATPHRFNAQINQRNVNYQLHHFDNIDLDNTTQQMMMMMMTTTVSTISTPASLTANTNPNNMHQFSNTGRRRNYPTVDSPLSSSPHPSSSMSSDSFSGPSSATALTTANSDESLNKLATGDLNLKQPINSFNLNPQSNINATAVYCTLLDLDRANASDNLIELDDQSHPPTPPPRSASTMCSQGLNVAHFANFPGHHHQQFVEQTPIVQTNNQPLPLHLFMDPTMDTESLPTCSLSRNHPSRSNVIQPCHRRTTHTQYQIQPFSSPTTVQSHFNRDLISLDLNDDACVQRKLFMRHNQLMNALPNNHSWTGNIPIGYVLPISSNSTTASATLSTSAPTALATTTNNTTTTTVWNGLNSLNHLHITNSNNNINNNNNIVSNNTVNYNIISNINTNNNNIVETNAKEPVNDLLLMNANMLHNLPRSASGGFIGPGEWNHARELIMNSNSNNNNIITNNNSNNSNNHINNGYVSSTVGSSSASLGLNGNQQNQLLLVQPGHPAFACLIAPFDWPKHLFKPDQDITVLMSWTKSRLPKRILVATETNLKKQVTDLFKMIQSFMGDRKARLSLPDYGSIIIRRALDSMNMRDELYAQLCKQTTGNPDLKSLTNGWALLCVCLYYFPPNSLFRDHLCAYLQSRAEASIKPVNLESAYQYQNSNSLDSSLKTAAAIASGKVESVNSALDNKSIDGPDLVKSVQSNCSFTNSMNLVGNLEIALGHRDRPTAAHFARVAPRWFVRSLNVGAHKPKSAPTIEEICHVKDFILKPCIFGSSLEEMMQIQAYRFPHLRLPWIQIFLTEELLRLNGAQTEGVFRLSPDGDVVTDVRCQLEKLFEIFRVVQLCDPDQTKTANLTDTDPNERYLVHRPPPPGWSTSARTIEPENSATNNQTNWSRSLLCNTAEYQLLTGEFQWPLLPEPLSLPPASYILLTPTTQWPRNLASLVRSYGNESVDAHLVAGLLKLWLRELSQPLIPPELQPICLKAASEAEVYESQEKSDTNRGAESMTGTDELDPIQKCCRLVRLVDPLTRRSLLYLILLLQHLAKTVNSSVSLMDARNLSTVIAPNLMRSNTTDPKQMMDNIRPQTYFVQLLIMHLDITCEIRQLLQESGNNNPHCAFIQAYLCPPTRVRLGPDNCFIPL